MKFTLSILISALFFFQSGYTATNVAFQNIKPVLKVEHGQVQKMKFKDFILSLPEFVRSFPEMENFLKHQGDENVTYSRADYTAKDRKYSRILLTVGAQSITIEIPENADALKGDTVIQIGKAKFRSGDFADLEKTMLIWNDQDPEFLQRAAVNESFRFLDPEVWKKMTPEMRVTVMMHLRLMAPDIEKILSMNPPKKSKNKKTVQTIFELLVETAEARTVGGACMAGGFYGTYRQNGFCGIAAEVVGFNCGDNQSACNPLFYRKTNGTRGLCVNVPNPTTDVVSRLCENSTEGLPVTNFQQAEEFVRAYLRNENQTATGFSGNLAQLPDDEKAKLEAYKNSLETAMQACYAPATAESVTVDNLSAQNCTNLGARVRLLQQAISGDGRGALRRAADWTGRTTSDAASGVGSWVSRNPWWTAGIAGVLGIGAGFLVANALNKKKKEKQSVVNPPSDSNSTCAQVQTCCSVNGSYSVYPNGCCGGSGGIAIGFDTANCGGTAAATTPVTQTPTRVTTTDTNAGTTTPTGEIVTSRKPTAPQRTQPKPGRK